MKKRALFLTSILLTTVTSVQGVISLEIETSSGFITSNFGPAGGFFPMSLEIQVDNGGSGLISQSWDFNDVIAFNLSVPSIGFNFTRDKNEFVASYTINSIPGSGTETSHFNLSTDSLGNIANVDYLIHYDLTSIVHNEGTANEFTSFEANLLRGNVSSTGHSFFTGDDVLQASISNSFGSYTENLSAVPEPSTYSLLAGMASLGLAALRRRSRSTV